MAETPSTQDPAGVLDGAAPPLIRLEEITKVFPGVVANDGISLEIHAGETHALLGENGAGKSTLISVLSGMLTPDAGRIVVDGRPTEISSPSVALKLGIGTVYQHLTLVPTLTVLENLMMGPSEDVRLPFEAARARFEELAKLLGTEFEPGSRTSELALGQQQQVEIMKALWRNSRVLILDEPTSMLTPQGVAELGQELERLKSDGLAVVFISHKLHEAIELGDRVSVLRAGRRVGSIEPERLRDASPAALTDEIVSLMFGEEATELADVVETELEASMPARASVGSNEVALEISHVHAASDGVGWGIEDIELTLHRGEVLGIAGVDGNGQKELAEVIAGQRRLRSGEIRLDGRSIGDLQVSERQQLGLRYVTDDRLGEGTVRDLDVGLNVVLKRIGQAPFWARGRVRRDEIDDTANELVERFDVRTPDVRTRIATLSGGNIQKVILARELSFEPRVVVFNKPTSGLDVKTAQFVRAQIREQAEGGVASLVISTELVELCELCDRVAVMSRGRVSGVVEVEPGAQQRIGALMVSG